MLNLIYLLIFCLILIGTLFLLVKSQRLDTYYLIFMVSIVLQSILVVWGLRNGLGIKINSVFGVLMAIQFVGYLGYSFRMFLNLTQHKEKVGALILMLVGLLFIPQIGFGYLYFFWGAVPEFGFFDATYFAFAINYSLPLANEFFEVLIKKINDDHGLRIIQMIHIAFVKIMEFVVIGVIIAKVNQKISQKS